MVVLQFDVATGVFAFRERGVVARRHAHPALEVIVAHEGRFTISSPLATYANVRFALVAPNQPHAFDGSAADCEFFLVEPGSAVLSQLLGFIGQAPNHDGLLALPAWPTRAVTLPQINAWHGAGGPVGYDERIRRCLDLINGAPGFDLPSLPALAGQLGLSASRLSHLFKAQVGLSVQKYLVWARLKLAISTLLRQELNLTEAAVAAGFYDSAHFSRHFHALLGLKPSAVYLSSRIVQASS